MCLPITLPRYTVRVTPPSERYGSAVTAFAARPLDVVGFFSSSGRFPRNIERQSRLHCVKVTDQSLLYPGSEER